MNQTKHAEINIYGAGLAGCEAAWQAANRGVKVNLYEMKPTKFTPAHHSRVSDCRAGSPHGPAQD